MKNFVKDFKDFIARGNVMDMAVGVIIGGAFAAIVGSLVEDIFTPIISWLVGSDNFDQLVVVLGEGESAPTLFIGNFLNAVIKFLMIALLVFIIIRQVQKVTNRFKKKEEEVVDESIKDCPYCLSTIPAEATRCPNCTSHLDGTHKA